MTEESALPRRKITRAARVCALTAAAALALTGCISSSGGAAGDSLSIAALLDLTGANSAIGVPAQAGTITAIKEINAAGGVNGVNLSLKTYDAQSDVTKSGSVIRDAIASKPVAIVGEVVSSELASAAAVITAGGVPWVTVNTPSPVTDKDKFWFTTAPGASAYAQGSTGALTDLLGSLSGKTIALQGLTSPAVDANLDAIKAAITQAGGKIGPVVRDPLTVNSWTSQAAKVVNAHADAIVLNDNEPVTAVVAKALGVANFRGPILSLSGASSDSLLSSVNIPNFYALRETVSPAADSALSKAAKAAGQDVSNVSNPFFLKSYADVYIVAAVLKKCGNKCSSDEFTSTLKGLGPITVPNGVMAGAVNFADAQSGLTATRVWAWDSAKKASVVKSDVISINPK